MQKPLTNRVTQPSEKKKPSSLPAWTTLLTLLVVFTAAYGLLLPQLGLYQDDWHPIFYWHSQGIPGLVELYQYDTRPLGAWLYVIGFSLLGVNLQAWHLLAFALRLATVLVSGLTFAWLWPTQRRVVFWATLLFAAYPFFSLQPMALTYTHLWTSHLLLMLSLFFMVAAERRPRAFWLLTALALLTQALHLFTIEFFAGLEIIRPVLLYFLLSERIPQPGQRLLQTFKRWLPYLLVLVLFIVWRAFFQELPTADRNVPSVLFNLFSQPLPTVTRLFFTMLQDATAILLAAWYAVFDPKIFDPSRPANLIILALSVVTATGLFFYLSRLFRSPDDDVQPTHSWARQALLIGLLVVILGPVPAWMVDQTITTGNPLWSSRYGMGSMFGASLLIVALLEILMPKRQHRTLILALLIGFAIGWHLHNANDYRWSWTKQTRFYQQLYWRAPYIKPNTAIISDGEVLPLMGYYPTSFALNTLYPQPAGSEHIAYWYFGLNKQFDTDLEKLRSGMQIEQQKFSAVFSGSSLDSLIISFEPENNRCLWVLRPEDGHIKAVPDIVQESVGFSNLNRIQSQAPDGPPPAELFETEPQDTWCYFYEKADLARQFGDWQAVVGYWRTARQHDQGPGHGVEFIPFIEGFAHMGDWNTAVKLTRQSSQYNERMDPALCATWDGLENSTAASPERRQAQEKVYNFLTCTLD